MSVERSCKDDSRNQSRRRHLCCTAAELPRASWLRRCSVPYLPATSKIKCEQPAPGEWVREIEIRQRKVNVPVVRCTAPFDAAQRSAVPQAAFPKKLPASLRIERVYDPGFLR